MRNLTLRVLGWMTVAALAGCDKPVKVQPVAAGPGRSDVEASVGALGGREAWAKVQDVGTLALVSLNTEAEGSIVTRQIQTYDLVRGTLIARGTSPGGPWWVQVCRDGTSECHGPLFVAHPSYRKLFADSLGLLLHRVSGTLNFVFGTETPAGSSQVVIDRIPLTRIGIQGAGREKDAYLLDPKQRLIRFVTAGGEQPGQDGTVTEYTYEMLPNGMAFPSRLRVVTIGRTELRGGPVALEAEFSSVRIR